jgi:hypothetical protein
MPSEKIIGRPTPRSAQEFVDGASADMANQIGSRNPGRPLKKGEPRRLKAFNLPLSLIEKIEREADSKSGGNASAFAIKVFNDYFSQDNDID